MSHLFPYKWYLKDGYPSKNITKNNLNVFGTFICGGGSTMGYKLAGFNHLGGVEIDKQVAEVYKLNHNPKYLYNMDIRDFNQLNDLPKELFSLDILDGSPPCSTFSMAGKREKAWNKEKKFREGQAKQRLDDLVFVYLDTIFKLKPKVAILENVKGLIQGNAKIYVKQIIEKLNNNGYNSQIFLLNAASMGVPQRRERVFIIASQKELKFPKLKLEFNEEPILFSEISKIAAGTQDIYKQFTPKYLEYWHKTKQGDAVGLFNATAKKVIHDAPAPTLTAGSNYGLCHSILPRPCSKNELIMIGTYPIDYKFSDFQYHYLMGMSVPPVMTAQISNQINLQWFK